MVVKYKLMGNVPEMWVGVSMLPGQPWISHFIHPGLEKNLEFAPKHGKPGIMKVKPGIFKVSRFYFF